MKFDWKVVVGLHGMMLATTISYVANNSLGWVILHGAFGWIYVIYHAIQY